mmetsp:Transcript_48801/g.116010  ORF Transcript_48801/g.116010 Transcript_48801/m.116010 type:complete len:474 (-) Transcript_48801:73-1494(-)
MAGTKDAGPMDPKLEADMKEFLKKNGLDAQAEEVLRSVKPEDAQKSLSAFVLPEDVKDPSGAFLAFQRRRTPQPVEALQAALARGAPASEDVLKFMAKHELSGRALEVLRAQPAASQQSVLTTFEPPSDVRNINGFFISYTLRAAQREKQRPAPRGAAYSAPVGGAPSQSKKGGSGPPPDPPGLEGQAKGPVPTVDEFVDKFKMDDSSRKLLTDLDDKVKKVVLTNFKPSASTNDVNKKLVAYVESQVQLMKTEGGVAAVGTAPARRGRARGGRGSGGASGGGGGSTTGKGKGRGGRGGAPGGRVTISQAVGAPAPAAPAAAKAKGKPKAAPKEAPTKPPVRSRGRGKGGKAAEYEYEESWDAYGGKGKGKGKPAWGYEKGGYGKGDWGWSYKGGYDGYSGWDDWGYTEPEPAPAPKGSKGSGRGKAAPKGKAKATAAPSGSARGGGGGRKAAAPAPVGGWAPTLSSGKGGRR